jgi:hypothetical protein
LIELVSSCGVGALSSGAVFFSLLE